MAAPDAPQPPWLRYTIVITGLVLVVYEAVFYRGEPRYWLLVVYTGMIGIPSLFGLDVRRRGEDPPAPPSPPAAPTPTVPPASPPAPPTSPEVPS